MRQSDLQVWKVQCDCGNRAEVFECDLVSGAITSCGQCDKPTAEVIDLAPVCPDCGGAITRDMRGTCHLTSFSWRN